MSTLVNDGKIMTHIKDAEFLATFDDILACVSFFVAAAFVVFLYCVVCPPGNAAHYKIVNEHVTRIK